MSNKNVIRAEIGEKLFKVVERAFDLNEDLIVHELKRRLKPNSIQLANGSEESSVNSSNSEWQGVESMSRLRSIVGGRFQNLKERWLECGFPLKEHRGSKQQDYKLNQSAWIELANWITQQGFEARLTPGSEEYLFEVRKK